MSFRLRLTVLAVLPLVVVTAVITWIGIVQVRTLTDEQLRVVDDKLRRSKEQSLKDYVNLALTAIRPVLNDSRLDDASAQREVKKILNGLGYGKDGYFFVYNNDGVNLVHPIQAELVGKNLINRQDLAGDHVIQALLGIARQGGGFHEYYWNKPSTHTEERKIAYVIRLPRWGWMLGSGLYLDDLAAEKELIRDQLNTNVKQSITIIAVIVAISSLLITGLMVFLNIHEGRLADSRLRGLAQNFIKLQIQERRQFSRELHDGINQLMVAIKFRMELAMNQIKKENVNSAGLANMAAAFGMLTEVIKEVRRISHALRPGLLDRLGLVAALQDLFDQFHERTGIPVAHSLQRDKISSLPDDVEITLYRVIQEALTNIERHASAHRVTVELVQEAGVVRLSLEDDGKGFIPGGLEPDSSIGIGLVNMRERVELLDGKLEIESEPGRGTRIRAVLPCSRPQH